MSIVPSFSLAMGRPTRGSRRAPFSLSLGRPTRGSLRAPFSRANTRNVSRSSSGPGRTGCPSGVTPTLRSPTALASNGRGRATTGARGSAGLAGNAGRPTGVDAMGMTTAAGAAGNCRYATEGGRSKASRRSFARKAIVLAGETERT